MSNLIIKVNNTNEELKDRVWFNEISLKPGINLLFGGNGAGKTSFINLLQSKTQTSAFEEFSTVKIGKDIDALMNDSRFQGRCIMFSNSLNNAMRKEDITTVFDMVRTYQGKRWSEGMNVAVTVYDFLFYLENYYKIEEPALVLLDEFDSGLDAVACRQLVKRLFEIVNKSDNKFYVLLSFNQYEVARAISEEFAKINEAPFWLNCYTGKEENIPASYEEYYNYLESQKITHRRLGDEGAWGADEKDWWDPVEKIYQRDKKEK